MKNKKYDITCTFIDGKCHVYRFYNDLVRKEAEDTLVEYLDIPKTDGVVAKPSLKKIKESLSQYCSDEKFLKDEFRRQIEAFKTWTKISKFFDGDSKMISVRFFNETIIIEAN